jgi:hypothetical protein
MKINQGYIPVCGCVNDRYRFSAIQTVAVCFSKVFAAASCRGTRRKRACFGESGKLQDRLDKLVAEGSVEKLGDDSYRLSNWSHLAGMN